MAFVLSRSFFSGLLQPPHPHRTEALHAQEDHDGPGISLPSLDPTHSPTVSLTHPTKITPPRTLTCSTQLLNHHLFADSLYPAHSFVEPATTRQHRPDKYQRSPSSRQDPHHHSPPESPAITARHHHPETKPPRGGGLHPQVMTRPKFRPCPSCQTPNQASRKTCCVCFGSLSTKQKIKNKMVSLDSQWGQSVIKSRNAGRIIDSARIAVTSTAQQLDNDIPIAEQHNSPSQCSSSILKPESLTVEQLEGETTEQQESITMELSESLTVDQPESLTMEQQESGTMDQPESLTVDQPESVTVKQSESLTVEQQDSVTMELSESLTVDQPESLTKESETVFVLNLVPLSSPHSPTSLSPSSSTAVLPPHSSPPPPPLPCSKSLRQRKKKTKTKSSICSPAHSATSVSPPCLITTDLSLPQSCPPPAASSVSQSLSQEGPYVKKRRKGKFCFAHY
ncbi:A-kinase anchor protein 5 [Labeo rohita]|uniref:A-kinase anchor protein 5 n=2 Tax=Labeo rohita TaxID=84645 RepID=A0ABQ8L5P8_LABRO|nr:A-kinase anchor protein 5 [Labeo rohita]